MSDRLVKLNKDLGIFLLDSNFTQQEKDTIIEFVQKSYTIAYKSGYLSCQADYDLDEVGSYNS